MEDLALVELLRRAIALISDKLNEHNPDSGFLFAVDHGLTEYLTMLTLAHACARGAISQARALKTITEMEEKHNARHTGTDRSPAGA